MWKIELSELTVVEGPEDAAWRRYFADRESEFRPTRVEPGTSTSKSTVSAEESE